MSQSKNTNPHQNFTRPLLTVTQFCERHFFISQGGIRYQIFNAKDNGLEAAGALVRLGRRVLIDENNYFKWIASQQHRACQEGQGNEGGA